MRVVDGGNEFGVPWLEEFETNHAELEDTVWIWYIGYLFIYFVMYFNVSFVYFCEHMDTYL